MIVGIGELLWDLFPDGSRVAGGAPFNFAFHCHQLGHPATIVSRVGEDDLGRELREEVKRLGMSDEYIQTDREHPTGTVRVSVDANGQPSYEIVENVAWDYINWNDEVKELTNRTRAFCFGSLAQRNGNSRSTIRRFRNVVFNSADPSLVVCDLNLRQRDLEIQFLDEVLRFAHWIKLNDGELRRLADYLPLPYSAEWDAAEQLRKICSSELVCVSRGANGYLLSDSAVEGEIVGNGILTSVVDTVGAGDAFTAAMVCLHLEGKPLRECARFANRYAASVCEHRGATPRIDRRAIEAML